MSVDSGMLVVITIVAMYMTLVFGLLFYVKNEWCDILHHNLTVDNSGSKSLYLLSGRQMGGGGPGLNSSGLDTRFLFAGESGLQAGVLHQEDICGSTSEYLDSGSSQVGELKID